MRKTYNVTVELRLLVNVPMPVEDGEAEEEQEDEAAAKVYAAIACGNFKDLYEEEIADAIWFCDVDKNNAQIIAVTEEEE